MIERKQTRHESAPCTNAAVETWYALHVVESCVGEIAECSRRLVSAPFSALLSNGSLLHRSLLHPYDSNRIRSTRSNKFAMHRRSLLRSDSSTIQMTILAQLNTSSFVPRWIARSSRTKDERRGMQIADYKLKSALEVTGRQRRNGSAYFILENLNSNPAKCTGRRVQCAAYIYMYMFI